MTYHSDQSPTPELPLEAPQGTISNSDLASFLKRLAALYKSPTTGNLLLSEALNELASWVSKRTTVSKATSKLRKQKSLGKSVLDIKQLKSLDTEAIEKFVADEQRTKQELIDLAYARFSIPRSQLKRSKISEVRETIRAAYLHEDSIEIISQEARRDGSNRSS